MVPQIPADYGYILQSLHAASIVMRRAAEGWALAFAGRAWPAAPVGVSRRDRAAAILCRHPTAGNRAV